jgi:hypothetical protein
MLYHLSYLPSPWTCFVLSVFAKGSHHYVLDYPRTHNSAFVSHAVGHIGMATHFQTWYFTLCLLWGLPFKILEKQCKANSMSLTLPVPTAKAPIISICKKGYDHLCLYT